MTPEIYNKIKGACKRHSFLLKIYLAFAAISFIVPSFTGELSEPGKLERTFAKVFIVGGFLVLFCLIEEVWRNRKRKS